MTPSNPNHHRQTTSPVTGPVTTGDASSSNTLGHQNVRSSYPAAYRVADIVADNKTRTTDDRDPKTSATPHQHPR
jgi:hypothetical protein